MNAQNHSIRHQTDDKKQYAGNRQLIIFRLGGEEYGLTIEQIKEVVVTPAITRVPQTASYIKGVANIRGNVMAMIDLEDKFGFIQEQTSLKQANKYVLVVESEDFKAGILVKEVPNTLTISENDIEDTGSIVHNNQEQSAYFKGIVKLDKRLIMLIDIFKVIKQAEVKPLNTDSLLAL